MWRNSKKTFNICPVCGKEGIQNIYIRSQKRYIEYIHRGLNCYFGEVKMVIERPIRSQPLSMMVNNYIN